MLLPGVIQRVHQARFLLTDHSTTILTGVGITGTVVTSYLTGRASFRAASILEMEQKTLLDEWTAGDSNFPPVEMTKPTKVKLVWRLYLPPVATGVITITCMVVANKISSKQIAALTIASGVSERALSEYKEKVIEKLGDRQNQKIRDEVAQDRISKHPVSREIVLAGTGEVLCYDMTTGRYFQSTMEEIKRAENKINYELVHHMSASLSEFYQELGLPATNYTDSVGWGPDHHFKVLFSTVLSPDGRPCIAVDFENAPHMEYSRIH